jgi:uroporphyrinogen-III decarboxylase
MSRETMTSRERVVRAINHEPVDRVPIDLGSHMSTGISMFAYWNLREHLGLSTDSIWIPDMVQCLAYVDVDVLNPVQISAENMHPQELKTEFGDEICFWGGGCNTQQVLGAGSPDDVARNVRELVETFKTDGGFVFNQVHNIMGDVPPENVVAMLDTAYEASFYNGNKEIE